MKLNLVLAQLKKYEITVAFDQTDAAGDRTIIVGCAVPSFPQAPRILYYTLTLPAGQDEVSREQRESMKRRLGHLTTDIFEEDEDLAELRAAGVSDEERDPHAPPADYEPEPDEE
jgi:hypothetical protein